ncbi:cysteine hydrolase family protein [Paenibacillus sp. NEAU-GSW1]|uniref:cysteine hydrolase family protein n=1 Tax=Paenibacillus sp. NEAU-GSW1 TaxID=2682486 RepID=UPI0012E25CDD|nr:cysteine hydrolase [Paenibacillus sp. NEAU-GSW1]MUT66479.1 isochorismatase family protein [Paenibacillus sp. NEAU-GSW1]
MSHYTMPKWNNSALLTIDMQNDFTLPGAPAEIPGTNEVLPVMRELLAAYRRAGIPIIHVVRLYKENGSNVDLCRREMIEHGAKIVAPMSSGADLAEAMKPSLAAVQLDSERLLSGEFQSIGANEWMMYKPRWGAFYQTDLECFLRDRGINTVVFSGCNFPNCPRTSIYEASERDFRTVLAEDAISGLYEKGLTEMRNIGVSVMKAADIAKALSADARH